MSKLNLPNILPVVSQHVALKEKGSEYVGCCPFHDEKSPSFFVNPSKQVFHCFGCGAGGNVIEFQMKYFNYSFKQALESLAVETKRTLQNRVAKTLPQKQSKSSGFKTISLTDLKFNESQNFLASSLFAIWYKDLTGAKALLEDWRVGGLKDGSTIFWYVNKQGQILNGKRIVYSRQGKRNRLIPPHYLYTKSQGFITCLYGEFQLVRKNSRLPVVLVESEKTALLASHKFPEFVWLATGGANSLKQALVEPLKGRSVTLIADADEAGYKGVEKSVQVLRKFGIRAQVKKLFPDRQDGFDLADYLILLNEINKLPPDIREEFEERAGIMEFEGRLSRTRAEQEALKIIHAGKK